MSSRQPARSQLFLYVVNTSYDVSSMHHQSEKGRLANDIGKSEGCIVPMKPGNSGGGKAAERWSSVRKALSGHRSGTIVRLDLAGRMIQRWLDRDSYRGEPDALTAHVRFWEGAKLN